MPSSAAALVNRCLLVGFAGTTLTDPLRAWLDDGLAGVVLFARNVADPEQVAALTAAMRARREDVLVAIDEEGGQVTRLQAVDGSAYPGNAALGHLDDAAVTEAVAGAVADDLAALGINVNLAPVADVNVDPANPVIGVRSFGADPALVARHVAAFVRGTQGRGVGACAKHFPGHGDTALDSHYALPTVAHDRARLDAVELPPFRAAVAAGVHAVMTAHVRYPALDDVPATVSRRILTDLLRGELGFTGVVLTDALEMKAVADTVGIGAGAVASVAAGADLVCTGLQERPGREAAAALTAAVDAGELPADRVAEAAERVRRMAAAVSRPTVRGHEAGLGATVAARALVVRDPAGRLPLRRPAHVVELNPSVGPGIGGRVVGVHATLAARRPDTSGGVHPADGWAAALEVPTGHQPVVVARDLVREPWQRDVLARFGDGAVVVLTGLATDAALLPAGVTVVACHGASRAGVTAAVDAIVGERASS